MDNYTDRRNAQTEVLQYFLIKFRDVIMNEENKRRQELREEAKQGNK